jgi:hypothetical protein
LDRQLNVSSAYLANPGSFQIRFFDFTDPEGTGGTSGAVISGSEIIDCQQISPAPTLQISEIFWGNEQRDFYIEILAPQDFT